MCDRTEYKKKEKKNENDLIIRFNGWKWIVNSTSSPF